MLHGYVKFFRDDGGFGFLARDDGQSDVFVHRTALLDRTILYSGERVSFTIGRNKRNGKPQAENVRLIEYAA
jgi:CspA family cold shock protein